MRYEDASGSFQASGPIANDDSDTLPAGSRQAATGNLITGEGTQYGSAGADSAAGAHITSIAGKGGEDTSFAGGKLSVTGEHGNLSVDAEGNYNYMANKGAPENVRDRFTYTLADNQGNSDTAALVIELGKTPVVIKADAQQIVPGPDGVVTLPPGVDLSDVMVVGRNLVINMPDGTQLIIVDGAIFVPQLVFDGVQVPATNVAALLIGQEPQPAAGELPPSSGGNFALPPPPLDPGVPLGDLIPPTVRDYIPPEPQEVFDELDRDPEVTIEPVDQAPSVNAVDQVDEAGLPARDGDLPGEPEGSGEEAAAGDNGDPSEATSGVIHIDSPDGVDSVTINGELVTGAIGQEIEGDFGTLTITGFAGDDILYSYVLNDNTSGDDTHDDFVVTLTDDDGDVAVATLVIDIIDDVPTARDDVDSVTEGGPEVADGNVFTGSGGADANSTDGVADTTGADDADLTGFSQGGSNGTLGAPFAAQYGTLVLNADGSYTYTLDGDNPTVRALGDGDTLTEVFTYTIEDGDGDVDTATLTITINGTNEAPVIGNDAAVVSEEGLPPGIEDDDGVPSDTTNSPTDSGTISVSDPDGDPVTVTLSLAGLPALTSNDVLINWALSDGGHTLTGTAGTDTIITITIDDAGNWDVVLTGPVDHDDETVEDVLTFDVQVVVDDGSETDTGTLTVTIEDDSPVITAGEVEPQLVVDESELTTNDTENFGNVFTALFGGDGGDPDEITYALGIGDGDTGLVDTLSNEAIVLSLEGGEVVGRTEFGGEIVFVVSVDADGNITVDQQRAVVHPDTADHDDSISLASDDLITLTATATDNDGDSDSATIGIGRNVELEDDGPSIDRNQNAAPDLVTDDTDIPDSDSANFAGLFTGAFGADGPKDVDDNDVADPDAISYSLSINGGDGTDSGLVDVVSGDRILLRVDGDSIEGYLENDTGVIAFTLTLDPETGEITQQQLRAITHDDPLDPVESGDSAATMAANLIVLTATITDGDLDTDTATASIGDAFHFEDDGPSAVDDVDSIEGGAGPATGNVITGVDIGGGDSNTTDGNADDVGEDTPGTITKIVSVNVPANEDTTPDGSGDFVVVGQYGTLTINEDGSYSYTRTDLEAGGVDDVFTYTLTDADGDSVTAELTISIEDNFPDLPNPDLIRLDDDVIPGADGNLNGPGDDDPDAVPGNVVEGQLSGSGGDAPLTYNFTGVNTLPDSSFSVDLLASDANTLVIVQDQNGSDVTVMTIELDQTDGSFTVTQNAPMLHPADEGGAQDDMENNLIFSIGVEVEDDDGDTDPATITINVDDDTPTVSEGQVTGTVDEDGVLEGADDGGEGDGIAGGIDDVAGEDTVATGSVAAMFNPGADQPLSYGFAANAVATLVALGLSSGGVDLAYAIDGDTITAYLEGGDPDVADDQVFTFELQSDGDWTFTLIDQLDHADGDDENDLTINLGNIVEATDADGDSVVGAADGLVITVDDDTPTTSGEQVTGTVDEDGIVENVAVGVQKGDGIAGGTGDVTGENTVATGSVAALFNSGADEPLSYGFVANAVATLEALNLTSGGVDLAYAIDGDTVTAYLEGGDPDVAADQVFTFELQSDGDWTFTLIDQLDHPTLDGETGDDTENDLAIDLSAIIEATDADGDSVTAAAEGLIITVDDDSPKVNASSDAEGDNVGPNPSAEGTFDFDIGADENADNDDIFIDPDSVVISINGVAIDPSDITFGEAAAGEDEHTAEYEFSFIYATGPGTTDTVNGTLIFYKDGSVAGHAAGTYEVVLDSTVQGFTIFQTGNNAGTTFVEYDLNGGAPDVVTANLSDDGTLFAQFTAFSTANNSPFEHLGTSAGGDAAWNPNELFVGNAGNPQVSNTDAGVDGNTMDTGEVLDFNLYTSDPGSDTSGTPDGFATEMFIQFFQFADGADDVIADGDDIVVILKLQDANNPAITTTRAILVDYEDVFTDADTATGTNYETLVANLGSQDALVVIQSNDYNAAGENWVIVGAQIITDNDGTTGSGIDLDGDLGSTGASDRDQDGDFTTNVGNDVSDELDTFQDDETDVSGVKITSIGFLVPDTTDQSVTIDFDVTIEDHDGDAVTTPISVQIGEPPEETLAATSFSLMSQEEQLQKTAANSNTLTLAAAVAAAGVTESAAAHGNYDFLGGRGHEAASFAAPEVVEHVSVDDGGSAAVSMLAPEASSDVSAQTDTSSSSSSDSSSASNSLDDSAANAAPEPSDLPAGDDGAADSSADAVGPVAPTVAMVSAEALEAAANDNGDAQQGGSVEQIVADALHEGSGPDLDAVLANLPDSGNGALQAIAHMASPDGAAVSGWNMGSHGAIGAGFDMMFKMDVAMHHQDAVQPVQNG